MLSFLLGFLLGGLIFYFVGQREALREYADDIAADIKRKDEVVERERRKVFRRRIE